MNLIPKKQSQFELFPKDDSLVLERSSHTLNFKDLTVSWENAIVLCIIFVMMVIFFFAFGIEKGKKLVKAVPESVPESKVEELHIVTNGADDQLSVVPANSVAAGNNQPAGLDQKPQVLEIELDKEEILKNIYTIQVASFKLEKSAKEEATKLNKMGHETFIVPKGKYSIVCIGKFNLHDEAKTFAMKLKKRYSDCLVRRL